MEPRSSGETPQKQDTDLQTEFNLLQRKLVPLWEQIGRSDPGGPVEFENTTVVIPSISIEVDVSSSELQAYEQRFLFLLFLFCDCQAPTLFSVS